MCGCEGAISKFAVERRRLENDMLGMEASELRDSNVPVRLGELGVDEPLAGVLLGVLPGIDSRVAGENNWMLERLLPSWDIEDLVALLLATLGIYLTAQLRLF